LVLGDYLEAVDFKDAIVDAMIDLILNTLTDSPPST
jgi:hypothetical protein